MKIMAICIFNNFKTLIYENSWQFMFKKQQKQHSTTKTTPYHKILLLFDFYMNYHELFHELP